MQIGAPLLCSDPEPGWREDGGGELCIDAARPLDWCEIAKCAQTCLRFGWNSGLIQKKDNDD